MRNTKTSNVENRNNEDRETSSHCRMKVQKYLIGNINEFEIKDKNQNNREWWNVRRVVCLQIPQYFEKVEELFFSVIACTWDDIN